MGGVDEQGSQTAEGAPGMPPFAAGERTDDGDTTEEPTDLVADPGLVEDALPEM